MKNPRSASAKVYDRKSELSYEPMCEIFLSSSSDDCVKFIVAHIDIQRRFFVRAAFCFFDRRHGYDKKAFLSELFALQTS